MLNICIFSQRQSLFLWSFLYINAVYMSFHPNYDFKMHISFTRVWNFVTCLIIPLQYFPYSTNTTIICLQIEIHQSKTTFPNIICMRSENKHWHILLCSTVKTSFLQESYCFTNQGLAVQTMRVSQTWLNIWLLLNMRDYWCLNHVAQNCLLVKGLHIICKMVGNMMPLKTTMMKRAWRTRTETWI